MAFSRAVTEGSGVRAHRRFPDLKSSEGNAVALRRSLNDVLDGIQKSLGAARVTF
jgi:hypothetical protein